MLAIGVGGGWFWGHSDSARLRAELETRQSARASKAEELNVAETENAALAQRLRIAEKERDEAVARLTETQAHGQRLQAQAEARGSELAAIREELRQVTTERDSSRDQVIRYRRELLGVDAPAEVTQLQEQVTSLEAEIQKFRSAGVLTAPSPTPDATFTVTILSVSADRQVVAIDRGRAHGLFAGQILSISETGDGSGSLALTEVREGFSIARIEAAERLRSALVKGSQLRLSAPP